MLISLVTGEDNYNHLGETTSAFQGVKLEPDTHLTQSYDHIAHWSSRTRSEDSYESGVYHSAESSPMQKMSVSDDVFGSGPARMSSAVYKDLPANYEEPWDTQEKQMHLNRVLNRAEKKHERRQSTEKSSGAAGVQTSESNNSTKSAVDDRLTSPFVPKTTRIVPDSPYEVAWQSNANQRKFSDCSSNNNFTNSVRKPPAHGTIPSNYEDAWDLPNKQKEFEEKLQKARKERASKGQIREDGDDEVFSNMAELTRQCSEMGSSSRASNRSIPSPASPTSTLEVCCRFSKNRIKLEVLMLCLNWQIKFSFPLKGVLTRRVVLVC